MSASIPRGADLGVTGCHACGLLARLGRRRCTYRCPRCGAALHLRKPASVQRTVALVIASYILYLPANLLPIMETNSLFDSQSDTIMSGVVYLWSAGSWPLALVVFIASIVVPLLKLIALSLLVISVRWPSRPLEPMQRARLYRLIEGVGRWSMLDIFVMALLVALVDFQAVATVRVGPAAVAFAAVVVLTMMASMAFDPRLIWEAERTAHG